MGAKESLRSEIYPHHHRCYIPNFRFARSFLLILTVEIYGADLLEDQSVAFVVEGITRKVEREIGKAEKSETLIGLLDMVVH